MLFIIHHKRINGTKSNIISHTQTGKPALLALKDSPATTRRATTHKSRTDRRVSSLVAVVRVPVDTGGARPVRARELSDGGELAGAATSDGDVSATDVNLGTADGVCLVQGNVFDADDVVAGGDGGGDCEAGVGLWISGTLYTNI